MRGKGRKKKTGIEKNFMTEGWKEKKRTEISRRLDMGSYRSSYVRTFIVSKGLTSLPPRRKKLKANVYSVPFPNYCVPFL